MELSKEKIEFLIRCVDGFLKANGISGSKLAVEMADELGAEYKKVAEKK